MPAQPCVVNPGDPAEEAWNDAARGVVTWKTLLSGDRTPTEGLTMGVAEVVEQAGGEARLHRHAQAEAYYILSGRGVLHMGGETWPLAPGVTAFIPGGTWHAARGVGPEPLRLLYVFAADSFADIVYEFPTL
jgi:mannose-6-phosphate isomerase-like protein (cupin superfamily)